MAAASEEPVDPPWREPADDERFAALLEPVGFADWRAAARCLQRIARHPRAEQALSAGLSNLLLALSDVANPDRALINLERFSHSLVARESLFRDLAVNPRAIEMLLTLFAGSQFLTEILLRNPEYLARLTDRRRLAELKSREQLVAEARAIVAPRAGATFQSDEQLASVSAALRRFQRRELLRIGACDFFALLDLPSITRQLSHLADSTVQACLDLAAAELATDTAGFAVLAMGKLGGEELNYSSDIDLLFLSSDSAAHQRLGQRLIELLASTTWEGFLYRVDMRLRPWGQVGPLVTTLEGYTDYLHRHARFWEKQALLKARVIAGDTTVGIELLQRAEPLLFQAAPDVARAEVRAMKERIEARLRQRGRAWGDVKSGEGSIRDIEFVTQYLQLVHGARQPRVRSPNTLDALARLAAAGALSVEELRVLVDAYIFLRTVEHYLQLMDYRQVHALPSEAAELHGLARRLGFRGRNAGAEFLDRYERHGSAVRAIYRRHLEARAPILSAHPDSETAAADERSAPVAGHLARLDASYATIFSPLEIRRHAELAEQLAPHSPVRVEAAPLSDGRWRVTIVGYDFLGALSLICGLLVAYGFDILDGEVFTYEPLGAAPARAGRRRSRPAPPASRRKIIDVFTVRSVRGEATADLWTQYAGDLAALVRRLDAGGQHEAQGEVARRVAAVLPEAAASAATLYPVEITIDNDASARYTVLHIDSSDTVGFLYELSNALALNGVYIARVIVETAGNRVRDTLFVTDSRGQKIVAPDRQRELRAATVLVKHFTHLLPRSPNAESALLHFRSFLGQLFRRPGWPDELASLGRPEVLDALARLLGVSDFLWDDFLRMQHDSLFPVVRDVGTLGEAKSKDQLRLALDLLLQSAPDAEARRAALNTFKDREMFRVDMRHILGHITEFGQFSAELSDLAEVVVEAAYRLCEEALREQFGLPSLSDGRPCPLAICGLGKFGGRELGFASDIELLFVFAGDGETAGPAVISASEFYVNLVRLFTQVIRARREGIFEIDLRLRPYGRAGSVAVSLDAFRHYFGPGGDAWPYERQALVKLRPVAGDPSLGAEIAALRDRFVYTGEPFDVAAMRAMRERQIRQLVKAGTLNAKYSPGGLVDVEYLVQGLQITHGLRHPGLRLTNTREAMAALASAGILPSGDFTRLREAHIFLRRLINALRVVRGNARDLAVPPAESAEFGFLCRRLHYGDDVARLRADLLRHTSYVQELSARLFR